MALKLTLDTRDVHTKNIVSIYVPVDTKSCLTLLRSSKNQPNNNLLDDAPLLKGASQQSDCCCPLPL